MVILPVFLESYWKRRSNIFIGVVTNNLNGVLLSTNGTVADTPELAPMVPSAAVLGASESSERQVGKCHRQYQQ